MVDSKHLNSKENGMALVSKPKGYVEPAAPEAATTGRKVVDVFAEGAPTGNAHEINTQEDAWERTAPPEYGRYSLQLFPGENTVTVNENSKGEFESYSINIMAKVVNSTEDNNGAVAFASVTTRLGRGKEISTAAGLICKLGYDKSFKPGVEYTDLQVAKALVTALKKEPVIANNLCDWKASYSYQDAKGKTQWVNVANTMEDFPVDKDGNRDSIIKVTKRDGSRDEMSAKFFVREWGGKGSKVEASTEVVLETQEEATVSVVKPNGKVAVQPVKKAPETQPVAVADDEEDMLVLEG